MSVVLSEFFEGWEEVEVGRKMKRKCRKTTRNLRLKIVYKN
jgi:hypothetical protein